METVYVPVKYHLRPIQMIWLVQPMNLAQN